jgi:hypothetical protein
VKDMKKFICFILCILILSGCSSSTSLIEITKKGKPNDVITVSKDDYQDIEELINQLSFGSDTVEYSGDEYVGIYITKGNTIHSYYIYDNGNIEYDKNNDKDGPVRTKDVNLAEKLKKIVDKMK